MLLFFCCVKFERKGGVNESMSAKKLQGADGLNFEMKITVALLENHSFPKESLFNESGNEIATIECLTGNLKVYVNLPRAVRSTNVKPFQLSDCKEIDSVRIRVVEFIKLYLGIYLHLNEKCVNDLLSQIHVTKMECNLTIQCLGKCKPKDVINLFEKAFAKVTIYKETLDCRKIHKKPKTGITVKIPHEWILKVYDKSFEQRKAGNLIVEPDLIRVELTFLDRMLKRMYSNKRSLEDILTTKSIKLLIDQYQKTFDDICEYQIKGLLRTCTNEVYESLTYSTSGKEIQDTVARCKEFIVDMEVLRKALKKWYSDKGKPDSSKSRITYYMKEEFGIPVDVLKTIKKIHISTGNRKKRE